MKWGRRRLVRRRRDTDTAESREALEATRRQREAIRPLVAELRHRADVNGFQEIVRTAMRGGKP